MEKFSCGMANYTNLLMSTKAASLRTLASIGTCGEKNADGANLSYPSFFNLDRATMRQMCQIMTKIQHHQRSLESDEPSAQSVACIIKLPEFVLVRMLDKERIQQQTIAIDFWLLLAGNADLRLPTIFYAETWMTQTKVIVT